MNYNVFNFELSLYPSNHKIADDVLLSVANNWKISEEIIQNILDINNFIFNNHAYIKQKNADRTIKIKLAVNELVIELSYSPFENINTLRSIFINEDLAGKDQCALWAENIYQRKNKIKECTELCFCWKRSEIGVDFWDFSYIHSDQLHARSFLSSPKLSHTSELSLEQKKNIAELIVKFYIERDHKILFEPVSVFKDNDIMLLNTDEIFYGACIIEKNISDVYKRVSYFSLLPEYDNPINRYEFLDQYNNTELLLFSEVIAGSNSIYKELKGNWAEFSKDDFDITVFKFVERLKFNYTRSVLNYWKKSIAIFIAKWDDNEKKYFKNVIDICFRCGITKISIITDDITYESAAEYFIFLGFERSSNNETPVVILKWGELSV